MRNVAARPLSWKFTPLLPLPTTNTTSNAAVRVHTVFTVIFFFFDSEPNTYSEYVLSNVDATMYTNRNKTLLSYLTYEHISIHSTFSSFEMPIIKKKITIYASIFCCYYSAIPTLEQRLLALQGALPLTRQGLLLISVTFGRLPPLPSKFVQSFCLQLQAIIFNAEPLHVVIQGPKYWSSF